MLLFWLIIIPLISSLLCLQCEYFGLRISHWIALTTMGLVLLLSSILWYQYDYNLLISQNLTQWNIEYLFPWIPRFNIKIHLALDGLSLLMIILTALLGILAVLCSWLEVQRYHGLFYLNLLWMLGSIIGIFLAIDMFLFFFFWEMMLIPMYFLIILWGNKAKDNKTHINAANKFFIYAQTSGLIMLISIIGLVLVHYDATNAWTFNYEELIHTPMSEHLEYILMLGFFLAFAIKLPIVPLHGWTIDTHSKAPISGAVDLTGILTKTSAYGLLRFSLPLFPRASQHFAPVAMWIGIITIYYGAWIAFSQINIKRLIAYASLSHMGFILIAIYSFNQLSHQGVILYIISHSLSSAGMFIICGQIYKRLYTYNIQKMGGLWSQINFIPSLSLFFTIAMLGIPGTGNFIGEITILFGSFQVVPIITVISTFGIVLSSVCLLIMLKNVYYGKAQFIRPILDVMTHEKLTIFLLLVLLLVIGLYPKPIIDISTNTISNIQHWITNNINPNTLMTRL